MEFITEYPDILGCQSMCILQTQIQEYILSTTKTLANGFTLWSWQIQTISGWIPSKRKMKQKHILRIIT